MKNALRRCACLALALLLMLPLTGVARGAGESRTLEEIMLDEILSGDRAWVRDTLVYDMRASNPIAILLDRTGYSLANDAIRIYEGVDPDAKKPSAVYRGMVNAMYVAKHAEEYLSGFLKEGGGELLGWVAEAFSLKELQSAADKLSRTREEKLYDAMLKSVLTGSYTASDGTTLGDLETGLLSLRQLQTTLHDLNELISGVNTAMESVSEANERNALYAEYLSGYAIPYLEDTQSALDAYGRLTGGVSERAGGEFAAALATLARLEAATPQPSYSGFDLTEFYVELLEESGVAPVLRAGGKGLDMADTALDSVLYAQSVRAQKEDLLGPLARLAASTDRKELREAAEEVTRLLGEEYDASLCSWDSIQTWLRSNRAPGDLLIGAAKKKLLKAAHLTKDYALGSTLMELTAIAKIGEYIVNKATGFSDMCEKTFELLYWHDLCEDVKVMTIGDIEAYETAGGQLLARAALDDLALLQKVRLFGETVAYELASAPNDKWLSWAWGGEANQAALDKRYQMSVDILLAAGVTPPLSGLTVPEGKTLTVRWRDGVGLYGEMDGAYVVELPLRMAGGLTVNGALSLQTEGRTFAPAFLETGSKASISLKDTTLLTGAWQAASGLRISAEGTCGIQCTESLRLGGVIFSGEGSLFLRTKDLALSGTDLPMAAEVSGTLSGTGSMPALLLTGAERQSASGSLTVTERLHPAAAGLEGGRSIIFTGDTIDGNLWRGDLTVKNAALSGVRFTGSVADLGGTVYSGGVRVEKAFSLSGPSTLNGTLSIYDTTALSADLSGEGSLELYGDLAADGTVSVSPAAVLRGRLPQGIYGFLTAASLTFGNLSGTPVRVTGDLTVERLLAVSAGSVVPTGTAYLGENALVTGVYPGAVSVENWNLPLEGETVVGSLRLRAGGTLRGGALRTGRLELEGAGTLASCSVSAQGLRSPESLTLAEGAALELRGRGEVTGSLLGDGTLIARSDLVLSGVTAECPIRLGGDLAVSGVTALASLTLDGTRPQHIAGEGFRAADLWLENRSGTPVALGQTVTVTGEYHTPGAAVTGGSIIRESTESPEPDPEETVVHSSLTLSKALTLTGERMTVEGNLTVPSLTVTEGSLTVKGKLTVSGTITLGEGSSVTVLGMLSAGGNVTLAGTLNVRSDAVFSAALTGGTLELGGDLCGAKALRPDTLRLSGLTPQRIAAGDLRCGDLILMNASRGGILIEKDLIYTGTLETDGCPLRGAEHLTKEAV